MYIICQQMSLRLDALRLIVFSRTMYDYEMVHFLGSSIHAKLDRVVESESSPPKRDLQLSFVSLTISKLNQTQFSSNTPKGDETVSVYILNTICRSQEAIIFGLPSMKIKMVTEEEKEPGLKKIHYDFASKFMRREGMADAEDIFIALNVALYSWLTILRKNFTKEMNQVQAAAERPVPTSNLTKKPAERLTVSPMTSGSLPSPCRLRPYLSLRLCADQQLHRLTFPLLPLAWMMIRSPRHLYGRNPGPAILNSWQGSKKYTL